MNSADPTKTVKAVSVEGDPVYEIEFSFCSLVTKADQYRDMVQSMVDAGFDQSCAEFLYLDNSTSNRGDGYAGLNSLANHARGEFIVFCHQDILAIDGPERLREILGELSMADPAWAVLGNAGLRGGKRFMFLNEQGTIFAASARENPEPVESLDENFILLRQDARLGFSRDLSGFHLYGTDLVTQARLRGFSSYAVDFRIEHFGKGTIDQYFHDSCDQFEKKYAEALSPRSVMTTCTSLDLGTLKGDGRERRITYFARGGQEFVRPSKTLKKALRSRLAQNTQDIDGIRFQHPQEIAYPAYHAMRKGLYELPKRNLIKAHLPADFPAVELGGSYGVVSGLINRQLDAGLRQVIVEANPQLLELCRSNALRGGADRDLSMVHCAIDYSGADHIPFNAISNSHDSHGTGVGQTVSPIPVPTMTLSQVLAVEDISTPYSLLCDINGAEFDVLCDDAEGLRLCQMMVVKLHPAAFYARGRTISSFFQKLDLAGFEVLANEATVIAAGRKPVA